MQIGNNMLLDAITWRGIPPIMFVPSFIARSFSLFHAIVIQTVYHSHGEFLLLSRFMQINTGLCWISFILTTVNFLIIQYYSVTLLIFLQIKEYIPLSLSCKILHNPLDSPELHNWTLTALHISKLEMHDVNIILWYVFCNMFRHRFHEVMALRALMRAVPSLRENGNGL